MKKPNQNIATVRSRLFAHKYKFLIILAGALLTGLLFNSCTMMRLRKTNPNEIGAVAESSARLSKIITQLVPHMAPSKRILEVGAGTGVFTEKLVKKLNPDDHLDIVELMPELCEILHEKFDKIPNAKVYCGDILEFKPEASFDYIVSGLPFNSFNATLVKNILDRYIELATPGALLSFFEYKWLPTLRQAGMKKDEKEAYLATRSVIESFVAKHEIFNTSVYINIPPAVVHFLRLDK